MLEIRKQGKIRLRLENLILNILRVDKTFRYSTGAALNGIHFEGRTTCLLYTAISAAEHD